MEKVRAPEREHEKEGALGATHIVAPNKVHFPGAAQPVDHVFFFWHLSLRLENSGPHQRRVNPGSILAGCPPSGQATSTSSYPTKKI